MLSTMPWGTIYNKYWDGNHFVWCFVLDGKAGEKLKPYPLCFLNPHQCAVSSSQHLVKLGRFMYLYSAVPFWVHWSLLTKWKQISCAEIFKQYWRLWKCFKKINNKSCIHKYTSPTTRWKKKFSEKPNGWLLFFYFISPPPMFLFNISGNNWTISSGYLCYMHLI